MTPVIKVERLTKKFGAKIAVDEVSFEVQQGEVFGLLGPNGSGKTTTLNMMLTLLRPTSGNIFLFGSDNLSTELKRTGVLLESVSYYPDLSAWNNLRISCLIKNISFDKIDEVLEKVGLSGDRNNHVKNFSLGMKQRLAMAAALLNDAELFILDEPTNGLDPIGIAEMRELILNLARDGKTVLIASHLLNEMEKICSHIGILKKGKVLECGPLKSMMNGNATLEDFFLAKTR